MEKRLQAAELLCARVYACPACCRVRVGTLVTSRGPSRNTTCMNLGKWQAEIAPVQRGAVASCWGGRARGAESLALLLLLLMSVNFIFFISLSTYFFVLLSFRSVPCVLVGLVRSQTPGTLCNSVLLLLMMPASIQPLPRALWSGEKRVRSPRAGSRGQDRSRRMRRCRDSTGIGACLRAPRTLC